MFKGMSKRMKVLLFLSLGINFIILGSFVGHKLCLFKGHQHHGMHHHLLKVIPEEKRAQVETILKNFKEAHPHKRGKFVQKWEVLVKILRQETFNREDFLSTYAKEMERHNKRFTDGGNAIADIAELLSPQERIKVLDMLKKKWERRRHFRPKHRH